MFSLMQGRRLRIGTRGSALARWQTALVAQGLQQRWPELAVETVQVVTRGDTDQSDRLVGRLDKGFFTAELEDGLRGGHFDLAVHSLKDLPTQAPDGLTLGAILPRGPVEDWLLVRPEALAPGAGPLPLGAGARVGTSAPRREALIRHFAPLAEPRPLRGNVPTRVRRLREGAYEAIVLAAAGLSRLKLDLSDLVVLRLSPERFLPAPGQGAIAVQCRADDAETLSLLAPLHDGATAEAVGLERALLAASEAGCTSAFGALVLEDQVLWGRADAAGWRRHRAPRAAVGQPTTLKSLLVEQTTLWEDDDGAPLYHTL